MFSWTVECQDAFVQLKTLLVSAPVLDDSTKGLGAVLVQEQEDGKVHLLHLHHDPSLPMSVTMLSQS